jgi:hypothetical protein
MAAGLGPVYFTDENTLGLGKLRRRSGRDDVVYPGHEELAEVPLGTLDVVWMPVVAQHNLIVLTRDRRIRTRPAELRNSYTKGVGRLDFGPTRGCEGWMRLLV